ncbi:MAG: hypothetical protein DMF78_06900 [Acidobacteria bacterium]|nr:MAG: hypothetical protein DMF78_06900 [Acidobacteriota bacterium]
MSLVLEALKKLDREKGRAERGFVVMAATPWPARAVRRWPLWGALLAVAVAAGAWAVMSRRTPAAASGSAVTAVSTPSVTVTAGAAAVPDVNALPAARVPPARRPPAHAAVESAGSPAPAEPRPAADVARPATATAAAAERGLPGLRLQAISERDGQPIAILSDHLVHVGDEFDGVRVIAIRESEVDVEVRGQRATLRF